MSNEVLPSVSYMEMKRIADILQAAKEIRLMRAMIEWKELFDKIDWPQPPPPELKAMSHHMKAAAEVSKLLELSYVRVHVDPAPMVAAARQFCKESIEFLDELEERLG